MQILTSLILFIWAAWLEIGGGYLVWQWLREDKSLWYAIAGGICLFLFGIVAACQPGNLGKVYTAYGGIFIAMSLAWSWKVDEIKPDKYDAIGALLCLTGACIIMYMPRNEVF